MTDVFISYKHRMRPRVDVIARELKGLGLTVWYDEGLISGSDYAAVISSNLRSANCVLVCWTNDVFEHGGDTTGWVRGEAEKGRARGVLVAASLEPDVDLDPPWNTVQFSDLSVWTPDAADRAAWRNTLRGIGALVGRPGLAAFDEAQSAGTAEALTAWAREYGDDPLAAAVWGKVTELAVSEAKARIEAERVRPKPAVAPQPTIQLRPQPAPQPQPRPAAAAQPLPADFFQPAPPVAPRPAPAAPQPAAAPYVATAAPVKPPPGRKSSWLALVPTGVCLVGGAILGGIVAGGASEGVGITALFVGLGLACLAYAWATVWMGALSVLRAIVFFVAMAAGAILGLLYISASQGAGEAPVTVAGGFGWIGAIVPLIALWLLSGRRRVGLSILAIFVGSSLAAVVCSSMASIPQFAFNRGEGFIYATLPWQVVFGLSLVWLLYLAEGKRTPLPAMSQAAGRSASSM